MLDTSRKRQLTIEVLGADPGDRRHAFKDEPEHDPSAEPIDVGRLQVAVKRAPGQCRAADEVVSVLKKQQGRPSCPKVVSVNPRMTAIFDLIDRVALTATTVLIEGETGTGKEQVAQAIHQLSRSRFGPMVAVTCAALSEHLLESELFGHEKGAFTGASDQRKGRFELAQGGTLFLDEVGDMPPAMQTKLLRVMQERRFERVGGTGSIAVDVRVVAATNRYLRQMVRDGTFREDLYYRLNVVKLDLPPLRERREDIPLFAVHFTEKYAQAGREPKRISPACMELLLRYRWPGNIRQLENAIEAACVISPCDLLRAEDLPPELTRPVRAKAHGPIDWSRPLPDVIEAETTGLERHYLRKALKRSRGNVSRCARLCGLSRRSVIIRLAKYQIDKSEFKGNQRRGRLKLDAPPGQSSEAFDWPTDR